MRLVPHATYGRGRTRSYEGRRREITLHARCTRCRLLRCDSTPAVNGEVPRRLSIGSNPVPKLSRTSTRSLHHEPVPTLAAAAGQRHHARPRHTDRQGSGAARRGRTRLRAVAHAGSRSAARCDRAASARTSCRPAAPGALRRRRRPVRLRAADDRSVLAVLAGRRRLRILVADAAAGVHAAGHRAARSRAACATPRGRSRARPVRGAADARRPRRLVRGHAGAAGHGAGHSGLDRRGQRLPLAPHATRRQRRVDVVEHAAGLVVDARARRPRPGQHRAAADGPGPRLAGAAGRCAHRRLPLLLRAAAAGRTGDLQLHRLRDDAPRGGDRHLRLRRATAVDGVARGRTGVRGAAFCCSRRRGPPMPVAVRRDRGATA